MVKIKHKETSEDNFSVSKIKEMFKEMGIKPSKNNYNQYRLDLEKATPSIYENYFFTNNTKDETYGGK